MARDGFSTLEVAKISGTTIKTLDNWHRARFISPSIERAPGRGGSRCYSFQDLVAIRVVQKLREAGITTQALRRVIKYLRQRKGLSATEVLASTNLITDGRDVYEVQDDVMLSTLRKAGQRVIYVVPLDELVTEVQSKTRAFHAA